MSTHSAIVTVSPGKPLETLEVPTVKPADNEVRILVQWTASTPLDLHQADGGLLVKHPQVLGDGVAGPVVEVGPSVTKFKVGDKVFGFGWRKQAEKAHQIYCTAPEVLFGKVPPGFSLQQAVVVPNNFVTAWHTLTKNIRLELPWPKPEGYTPPEADVPILIWGGSSSCGQYFLQILKYYGYRNVIATASKAHHKKLQSYGAVKCFDYRQGDISGQILDYVKSSTDGKHKYIKFAIDCIGSQSNSVQPIAKVTGKGSIVAVLLPVIVRDAADGVQPEYTMDAPGAADWKSGVEIDGVRTHFYLDNKFLADHLQSDIMPAVLEQKIVEPNDQVIVEGKTMLERAEKALSMLRRKEVSGGRLVWRVADDQS